MLLCCCCFFYDSSVESFHLLLTEFFFLIFVDFVLVDFEMCLLRSCARVANFKHCVFRNGGLELFFFLRFMYTLHMVLYGYQGGINVLDVHVTYILRYETFVRCAYIHIWCRVVIRGCGEEG